MMYDTTKVTLELREIVESGINIWNFDYPSYYKGEEKAAFEQKVIDHYFFRQIGQETVGRFLHMFRTKVREIMPYYIERYKSVDLFKSIEDPLQSYELTEEFTRSTTGKDSVQATGTATEQNSGNHERRVSDTPMNEIENLESYMSEASKDIESGNRTANTSNDSESNSEASENYTLTRRGNIGVQPLGQELNELRKSFINVDMEIIDELKDLFLKVY